MHPGGPAANTRSAQVGNRDQPSKELNSCAKGLAVRKTADMLIATFCLENGHGLLHSNETLNQSRST